MNASKKFGIGIIVLTTVLTLTGGLFTIIVDPYFHYHAPLKQLSYPITNERYQNDGIARHFEYDAIITGTSMTENFKSSEFDALFHVNSVKLPFSGARYKEINENLERAVKYNPDLKIILRCLDSTYFLSDKDAASYDSYPTYLYDDLWYNDVNYLFNKTILIDTFQVLTYTQSGSTTTTFDDYCNWMARSTFGKDAVAQFYTRSLERSDAAVEFSDTDYETLKESLTQNVTTLAAATPDIDYYLFFPPYSIYEWDRLDRNGTLKQQLAAEKAAIELLLDYENIHLFSFNDEFDMVCNPDNYTDTRHYGEWINSQMLVWMKNGEHQLTKDNYQEYCDNVYSFYTEYDYDGLFEAAGEAQTAD